MNDRETVLAPGAVAGPSPLGDNLPLVPSSATSRVLVEEGFTLVWENEVESIFTVAN
jgi:hypothetical protein